MRCSKCGYISFDYNKFCPKCNKDISEEQTKLNLHSYKHTPPSLLGMLVGAGEESSSGFTMNSAAALQRGGAAIDDKSPAIIEQDMVFSDDDHELEISLSDDTELELPEISMDDESSDMDNLELGDEEVLTLETDEEQISPAAADTADDLSLELDDISMRGSKGFSTIELNVSDLKINDTGELEIDALSGEVNKVAKANNKSQILDVNRTSHLDLSDLTFDTDDVLGAYKEEADGTLKAITSDEAGKEESLDLGDLALDDGDIITDKDNEGLDLDSLIFEETDESESASAAMAETMNLSEALDEQGTDSLDLGDLAISDDDSIDLSDLTFDDEELKNTGEKSFAGIRDLDNQETGELKLEELNDENLISPDGSNLFDKGTSSLEKNSMNDSMSELNIDLENLDLDLDLDDTDKK